MANCLITGASLHRDTSQGCLLSLLTFAVTVQPLAADLRKSLSLVSFKLGYLHEKDGLFAADDNLNSLQTAMSLRNDFLYFSGWTINRTEAY